MKKQNTLNMNTIADVAEKINEFSGKFEIGQLQEIRKKIKKLSRFAIKPPKIFSKKSIKTKNDYAFHAGGYNELQYNICYENGSGFFRYGIAFSLQKSASFHDPVGELIPKINRFNEFLKFNPERYHNLFLWYFQHVKNKEKRSDILKISTISENLINIGTFIFIGKYLKKTIQKLNNDDIIEILRTFDDLLELYKYVERQPLVEEKIARICWNTNSWRYPSGHKGKSKDINSFEFQHGYGYEEWLLDFSKIINGYHYGFLEPFDKNYRNYVGMMFNISLYSIDGETRDRWWIGELHNVEVISLEENQKITLEYNKKKWLNEMKNQLLEVKADLLSFKNQDFPYFNIKFKINEASLLDEPLRIDKKDEVGRLNRYTLFNKSKDPTLEEVLNRNHVFASGHHEKKHTANLTYSRGKSNIDLQHNVMQTNIYKYLCKLYGKDNVGTENSTGYGASIDVEVREGSSYIFYEIKTSNSLKLCIREALGQLMEYSYWPDKNNAKKLVIVSQNILTEDAKS